MRQIIGKKQTSDNAAFVKARGIIEELVSFDEASALVASTVQRIHEKAHGKCVAYAWSGGKDSLALQYVCEKAGVNHCVMGVASHLEYPDFMRWVMDNRPNNLTIVDNDKLTLQWLSKHEDMLFPTESATAAKWFKLIQHRAQDIYFKEHNLDMIILGRRVQDGNYCGKDFMYTNGKGVTRFSPIADWKHEQVMAVIHYFMGDNYPPIYDWQNGFVVGTGVWPARQWCRDTQDGWSKVYAIDPQIVEQAARHIHSAKQFLENR